VSERQSRALSASSRRAGSRRGYGAAQGANSAADLAADALAGSPSFQGAMAAEPTPEYGE